MSIWVITQYVLGPDSIGRKKIIKCVDNEIIALEAFRYMYMKEFMNDHISFYLHRWDKELECYSTTNIIDAIQHSPVKKYDIKYSQNGIKDNWTFTHPKHIDLYKRFLEKMSKHLKESQSSQVDGVALCGEFE